MTFLYEKNYTKLVYYLVKKCQDQEKAKEYSSEAFMIAIEKIHQYDKSCGAFSTWLFKIALNLFFAGQLKNNNNRLISIDYCFENTYTILENFLPLEYQEHENQTVSQNDTIIKTTIIKEALKLLKPHLSEVIILRDINEYSYLEISKMLDININTLKSRIRNA